MVCRPALLQGAVKRFKICRIGYLLASAAQCSAPCGMVGAQSVGSNSAVRVAWVVAHFRRKIALSIIRSARWQLHLHATIFAFAPLFFTGDIWSHWVSQMGVCPGTRLLSGLFGHMRYTKHITCFASGLCPLRKHHWTFSASSRKRESWGMLKLRRA